MLKRISKYLVLGIT